jgi:folate-dependent phosphoribosylglycinamide formyltransferase PurN
LPICAGDTLAELEARVHAVEHVLLVEVLARLCAGDSVRP